MKRTLMLIAVAPIACVAAVYHIGPGGEYTNIGDAPLDSLKAGDSVVINYREEPYREKWVIAAQGTAEKPVVFSGVPDASGNRPVIDGENAVTPQRMNFWSEGRGAIKIGGSNNPPDSTPLYIIIENLEIRNASIPYGFTGRDGPIGWDKNAAAIFIEKGEHLIVRNCVMHGCGNGFFSAHQAADITVEYCYLYGNGNEGSIYEHNNYTGSSGIVFQFNRFGPLRDGAGGNNLKDRSAGCIIRYNWIESGNRQLDLVDADDEAIIGSAAYNATFVYGNILIEPDGAGNSQIIHYGGDSGDESRYRKGTLYLYNNTVVSTRTGNTTLLRLSSPGESADVRNNIVYVTESGSRLGIVESDGAVEMRNNWLKTGWRISDSNGQADVRDIEGNRTGDIPGFMGFDSQDFGLAEGSECRSGGTLLAEACQGDHQVLYEYVRHCGGRPRPQDAVPDIGAYEYGAGMTARAGLVPGLPTDCPKRMLFNPIASNRPWIPLFENDNGYSMLGQRISENIRRRTFILH
jgi:hypothetical protein